MVQQKNTAESNYRALDTWLLNYSLEKDLLVCGNSIIRQRINTYFGDLSERLGIVVVRFSDFAPNPIYEN